MAVATLVPWALENEHKKSDLTSKQKHPSDKPSRVNSPALRIGKFQTSGMVNFKQRMEAEGISEKVAKLIANPRRAGTQARYKSAWNKWVSWCTLRQIDPFRCSVKFVTNFIDLFVTRLEYRTLNSYRSAISAFHDNGDSVPTGRHPLVTSVMKGIGNSRPLSLRYNFIWDIEQVLKHITSLPPNNKLSLKLFKSETSNVSGFSNNEQGVRN